MQRLEWRMKSLMRWHIQQWWSYKRMKIFQDDGYQGRRRKMIKVLIEKIGEFENLKISCKNGRRRDRLKDMEALLEDLKMSWRYGRNHKTWKAFLEDLLKSMKKLYWLKNSRRNLEMKMFKEE